MGYSHAPRKKGLRCLPPIAPNVSCDLWPSVLHGKKAHRSFPFRPPNLFFVLCFPSHHGIPPRQKKNRMAYWRSGHGNKIIPPWARYWDTVSGFRESLWWHSSAAARRRGGAQLSFQTLDVLHLQVVLLIGNLGGPLSDPNPPNMDEHFEFSTETLQ